MLSIPSSFWLNRENLIFALEASFNEDRIGQELMTPYVRLTLPPIVLEGEEIKLPLHSSVKIFDDGITILSYQLKGSWEKADEDFFINEVVNLFNRYFEDIWIDAKIHKLEADLIIPQAYQDQITLAGKPLESRDIKRSIRKMWKEARNTFQKLIKKEGNTFLIGNKEVVLHKAAGSNQVDDWEANIDFCTEVYRNALSNLIVPEGGQKEFASNQPLHW